MNARGPRWMVVVVAVGVVACSTHGSTGSGGAGGGAQGGGGSGGGAASPLKIVSAKVTSGTELTLSFSEPVVPPTGVDPAAFKLSAAETFHAGGKYETLQLGYGNFLGAYSVDVCQALLAKCAEPSYSSYYQCASTSVAEDETYYHEVAKFEHLAPGAHPNELVATLARPIGSDISGKGH